MANTSTVTMKRSGNSSDKEEEGTTVTPLNPLTPPVRDRALVVLSLSYYIWYNVYDTCVYIYIPLSRNHLPVCMLLVCLILPNAGVLK